MPVPCRELKALSSPRPHSAALTFCERFIGDRRRPRVNTMIDYQIDEEMILSDEVSDEALEAAALIALGGFPTLPHTYCFACPSDPLRSNSAAMRSRNPG